MYIKLPESHGAAFTRPNLSEYSERLKRLHSPRLLALIVDCCQPLRKDQHQYCCGTSRLGNLLSYRSTSGGQNSDEKLLGL